MSVNSVKQSSFIFEKTARSLKAIGKKDFTGKNQISGDKPDAGQLARTLINDIAGLGTDKNFGTHIKQINEDNVVEVLENYKKLSKAGFGAENEETLIESIFEEFGLPLKTRKNYVSHIYKMLDKKSQKSELESNVISFESKKELNKVTQGFLPHIGVVDNKNLNFFLEQYSARLGIRKKLLAGHNEKKSITPNTAPDEKYLRRLKQILKQYGLNTNDALGNGKIDNAFEQLKNSCWAVSVINAFGANKETQEYLNSLIMKKNGITSVYLPEADKVYSYTENEILNATRKSIGALGDGDVTAFLMAVDEYLKESGSDTIKDVRKRNHMDRMFEILTGHKNKTWHLSLKALQAGDITYKDGVWIHFKEELLTKNPNTLAVISFDKNSLALNPVNGLLLDTKNKPIRQVKLKSQHSYSIERSDENYVYLKDTNNPNGLLRIPHSLLDCAEGTVVYKYR